MKKNKKSQFRGCNFKKTMLIYRYIKRKTVNNKNKMKVEDKRNMDLKNFLKKDGKIDNILLIEELDRQGYEIFYSQGNDDNSVLFYEDDEEIIFINDNYGYADIISKNNNKEEE